MRALLVGLILAASTQAQAQNPASPATPAVQDPHASHGQAPMLFPPREASGTSWLPDETPMFGVDRTWRGWNVMLHGVAFAQFLYEPGEVHRTGGFSEAQLGSVNWGMLMARRAVGAGRVGLRMMVSLEPWTISGCGSLNYLATGEMCDGDTIHDRQHPHDLIMELAADYDRPLRGAIRWQVYAGLAGEPALGPSGFPHRVSALTNPVAPIAHHWLDSSHITYGLVTTGVYGPRWKAEMSAFNGREPDTNRKDLDLGALDSVAGRLTILPTGRLALQVSAGHLREAEQEFEPQPRTDLNRLTASATYNRSLAEGGVWATTLAYGLNSGKEIIPEGSFDVTTYAVLLESAWTLRDRHTLFGRGEIVEKPGHDLHAHAFTTSVFTIGKLQGGYVRHFQPRPGGAIVGIGGTAAISVVPTELEPQYTTRTPVSLGLFLTVRPPRHVM